MCRQSEEKTFPSQGQKVKPKGISILVSQLQEANIDIEDDQNVTIINNTLKPVFYIKI